MRGLASFYTNKNKNMSRTRKKSKEEHGSGYEYWESRLHSGGEVPGAYTKERTHKKERRQKREIEREALERVDELFDGDEELFLTDDEYDDIL